MYGFVKQSRGHVKLYSEPGQGTTVRIYLPRLHGSGEAPLAEYRSLHVESGETVLVVEDDADVRAYTVTALRELGI